MFYKVTLTLHVLQFGTVGGEEGENSLRFPVTVDVKLQVGQHDAMTEKKKIMKTSHNKGKQNFFNFNFTLKIYVTVLD